VDKQKNVRPNKGGADRTKVECAWNIEGARVKDSQGEETVGKTTRGSRFS